MASTRETEIRKAAMMSDPKYKKYVELTGEG
jgi:hypothetical protein